MTYFDTDFGLVHDVTGTDCWAQNGLTCCRIFATFKRRGLASRIINRTKTGQNKQQQKTNKKTKQKTCFLILLYFLTILPRGPMMLVGYTG